MKKNLKDLPILLSRRKRSKYNMRKYPENIRATLDSKEIYVPKKQKFHERRERNEWHLPFPSSDVFILLFSFFTVILIIFTVVVIPNDSKLSILFTPLTTICCLITLAATLPQRKWFLTGLWAFSSILWIIITIQLIF